MKVGIRAKLFATSLLLLVTVGFVSGLYLESTLQQRLELQLEEDLWRQARLAAGLLQLGGADKDISAVDGITDRLGRVSDARFTIIDARGQVLGDSQLDRRNVLAVENHASRPEVRGALSRGQAKAKRYSTTIHTDMLYVAVAFGDGSGRGVVRVAMPLSQVDAALASLRWVLLAAAGLGLVLAVLMSFLASHWMTRTLRQLVVSARAVARGERASMPYLQTSDELGRIAGSFNRVARDLEGTLSTLSSERDRLNTILESMSESVIALDAENLIRSINSAGLELFSGAGSAVGRPIFEVLRIPQLVELVDKAQKGSSVRAEFDHLSGETPRRLLAHAAPLKADGGCVLVMHDLTELRRLERMRQDFVANVSHELRTPVSVIRANSETLLDGALTDQKQARRFVEAIDRNAERLADMIADLLDLAKVESGKLQLEMAPVHLLAVAERALEAVVQVVQQKHQRFELSVDPKLTVMADAKAIEQILTNLFENAAKYTPEGGKVRLQQRDLGGFLRIEVVDNGNGIPEADLERVFERFYRLDSARQRHRGGTGLGLSIVKHLVSAMGGNVGVESGAGEGATFWFSLRS